MSFLNPLLAPVRSILGAAEQEAEKEFPVQRLASIEARVLETGEAIKASTTSISAHVDVIEKLTESLNDALPALTATLSTSLPDLVTAVQDLGAKLEVVSEALAPVVEAEQKVANVGHLLHHHHDVTAPAPETDGPASA